MRGAGRGALSTMPICAPNRSRPPIFWPSRGGSHTVMVDRIPVMGPEKRNEARRFVLLIDTLYDEGVKLVCSAAAPADQLYPAGDGAEAFRRTVSRLTEMQSADYLERHDQAAP